MQKIGSYMRRAITEFGLLEDGDKVAVGVSGGKDSMILLRGLVFLRRFIGINYDLTAITLDPCFGGVETNYEPVAKECQVLGVPYLLKRTDIGRIVFDVRKEPNPCSLCARMRRGALHDAAKEAGCNKVALGHHLDDAVETFLMNLFNEGRIGCYAPKSYLSRKELTLIRPLSFVPEQEIKGATARLGICVVKSKCKVDGNTSRQTTKEFIRHMDLENSGFKHRVFGAMRRGNVDGWGIEQENTHSNQKLTNR